jgi:hypothetical protein
MATVVQRADTNVNAVAQDWIEYVGDCVHENLQRRSSNSDTATIIDVDEVHRIFSSYYSGTAQPSMTLSNAKIDPFATYPIALDHNGHQLVSYFFGMRGQIVRRGPRCDEMLKQTQRTIFTGVMQYPLSFQTSVIELAAMHHAEKTGKRKSISALKEKLRSIQMLTAAIHDFQSSNIDDLIMAMSGAAIIEDRYGSRGAAQAHMKAMVQMIELRGGPAGFTGIKRIFWSMILWSLYTVQHVALSTDEVKKQHADLTGFVRKCASTAAPSRWSEMLQHRSLRQLLLCHRELIREQQLPLRNIVMYCSLAVPIYIITALIDYNEEMAKRERFIENVVVQAALWGLEDYPDMNAFTWMLLHEELKEDVKSQDRPWRAFKILNAIKRLPLSSQIMLRSFFLDLLLSPECAGIEERQCVREGAMEIIRRDSMYSQRRCEEIDSDDIGSLNEMSIPRSNRDT